MIVTFSIAQFFVNLRFAWRGQLSQPQSQGEHQRDAQPLRYLGGNSAEGAERGRAKRRAGPSDGCRWATPAGRPTRIHARGGGGREVYLRPVHGLGVAREVGSEPKKLPSAAIATASSPTRLARNLLRGSSEGPDEPKPFQFFSGQFLLARDWQMIYSAA